MKKLVAVAVAGVLVSGLAQAELVSHTGVVVGLSAEDGLQNATIALDGVTNHCGGNMFYGFPSSLPGVFEQLVKFMDEGRTLTVVEDTLSNCIDPDNSAAGFVRFSVVPLQAQSEPIPVVVTNPVDVNVLSTPAVSDTECVRYETSGMLAKTGIVVANTVCAEWR